MAGTFQTQSEDLRQRMAAQFERAAHALEVSAQLADEHAEVHRRRGRAPEEALELQRAQFALDAARRDRHNALRLVPPPPAPPL